MTKRKIEMPPISDEEEARIQAGIANDPDNPELTDEELAQMRPAREVLPPALYAALTRPRGRPKAEVTKLPVTLRLDRDVVEAYKDAGAGWQTRMNEVLRAGAPGGTSRAAGGTVSQKTMRAGPVLSARKAAARGRKPKARV